MKLRSILAFFGLVAQMAAGQVLEVKSPTIHNLNCVITHIPVKGSTDLNIFIFGDQGEAYVSRDKAQSWQRLDVDPIQKRNIKVAARISDKIMFVAGGSDNRLLKLSTDDGETWQDFVLPDPDGVTSIGFLRTLNQHPSTPPEWRDLKGTLFVQESSLPNEAVGWFPEYTSEPYIGKLWDGYDHSRGVIFAKGRILAQSPDIDSLFTRFIIYDDRDDAYQVINFSFNVSSDNLRFSWTRSLYNFKVTTIDSYDGIALLSLNNDNCLDPNYFIPGRYNWETQLNGFKTDHFPSTYRNFPELGANVSIKSSAISHANKLFWHVGGDKYGQNGVMVSEGVVTKFPDFSLNEMKDCSYNGIDAVIAVGNYGRIYSNRTDLALATPVFTISKTDKISAYPNPFNSEITIMSEAENYVSLINISGILLKQIQLLPGPNYVSLAELNPGIYFLKKKQQVLKLVKQ